MANRETLHQIFEGTARRFPEHIAVRFGDQKITYRDLDRRSDALSARLKSMGIDANTLVGLCVERSIEMIVGMLAILKAGGAYLPIDPAYPKSRIDFLLADSGTNIVVTTRNHAEHLGGSHFRQVSIDEPTAADSVNGHSPFQSADDEKNLAYVIYTSGSSGKPKGVLIDHRNVTRLFDSTRHWFGFNEQDVWLMFHSISFDFSVWEIWGALLHGGTLVVVPLHVVRSPELLRELILREKATILCQTPSAFQQFIAFEKANPAAPYLLRQIIFGGEALHVAMLHPWIERYGLQKPALVNMYGITETTVHVTWKRITEQDLAHLEFSLIGIPIPDLQVTLLDEAGKPAAEGTPGEIHVSGPGVARGYLNRPELTAERFLRQPDGTLVYRSGDLATRQANGELIYLGRVDDQIKVRGFRIEPREIELCLSKHPDVKGAIVLAEKSPDGDVRLLTFVAARPGLNLTRKTEAQISAELAEYAKLDLPVYMRPACCFVLSDFPLTSHGKIDRDALLSLAAKSKQPETGAFEGMTEIQQSVVWLWQDILQNPGAALHDDFFDLGGTSLGLVRLLAAINGQFGIRLNGSELGEEASIAQLAICIEGALKEAQELQTVEKQ